MNLALIAKTSPSPQDFLDLYVRKTSSEVNLNSRSTYALIAKCIFPPIVLASSVILIPLGGLSHQTVGESPLVIRAWCYVIFQLMYNAVAYSCMVRLMCIPLHDVYSWKIIWICIPIIGVCGVLVLYYCLVVAYPNSNLAMESSLDFPGSQASIAYLPIIGNCYMLILIWFSFGIGSAWKTFEETTNSSPKRNQSSLELVGNNSTAQNSVRNSSTISAVEAQEGGGALPTASSSLSNASSSALAEQPVSTVHAPFLIFYAYVLLMGLLLLGVYWWCCLFTAFFEQSADAPYSAYLVAVYLLVMGVAGVAVRGAASAVDNCSSYPNTSMCVVASIMMDTFLVVFQRNLFSFVTSWSDFTVVTVLLAVYEVLVYQLQLTTAYERLHDRILATASCPPSHSGSTNTNNSVNNNNNSSNLSTQSMSSLGSMMLSTPLGCLWYLFAVLYTCTHNGMRGNEFVNKNALHISYRFVLRISSTLGYIIFTTVLTFGYNAPYYTDTSARAKYRQLMGFVMVSFLVDLLIIVATDLGLARLQKVTLARRFVSFFGSAEDDQYLLFLIWATAHITTDVFVAKIMYNNVQFEK